MVRGLTPSSSARTLRVQTPRTDSTAARTRSASVIFCRKTPPRVPGSRSRPRRRCRRRSVWAACPRGQPFGQPLEFLALMPVSAGSDSTSGRRGRLTMMPWSR
jgi:hypothetical protein